MSIKKREKRRWYRNIKKNLTVNRKINLAKERISDYLELPLEIMSKVTKITIINNTSLLIEGYDKIIDYYDDYIKIKGNSVNIIIDGEKLDIQEITDYELVIEGQIYSINYKR